jgi:hypothetical protein
MADISFVLTTRHGVIMFHQLTSSRFTSFLDGHTLYHEMFLVIHSSGSSFDLSCEIISQILPLTSGTLEDQCNDAILKLGTSL